jgi:ubiquinone/menaquinone biosynthesis C-methylase UbiE
MPSTVIDQRRRDEWAEWLLHRRYGGDPAELQRMLDSLYPVRDKVLANARLAAGETVLDVGTGNGLMAFEALERIGESGQVIFLDTSQDLLDFDKALAEQMGLVDRCRFVGASADDLSPIATASVDVVTTRSVVMYVPAKHHVFHEFHRVLRSGGRVSMYERINSFGFPEPPHFFWGRDVTPVQDLAVRVRRFFEPPAYDVLLNFNEHDLLAHAEQAGFDEVHLELRADVVPNEPADWEAFARAAQPPPGTTLAEAIEQSLTAEEAARFVSHLRPLVETGAGKKRWAAAYLWATKR